MTFYNMPNNITLLGTEIGSMWIKMRFAPSMEGLRALGCFPIFLSRKKCLKHSMQSSSPVLIHKNENSSACFPFPPCTLIQITLGGPNAIMGIQFQFHGKDN